MIALNSYKRANGENDLSVIGNLKKTAHLRLVGRKETRRVDSITDCAHSFSSSAQRNHFLAESGTNTNQPVGVLHSPFQQRPYVANGRIKVDVGSSSRPNHGDPKHFPEQHGGESVRIDEVGIDAVEMLLQSQTSNR